MILVFSDLHLGRSDPLDNVLIEELLKCVSSYRSDLDEVIFLGDVFDSYMEYRGAPDPVAEKFAQIQQELDTKGVKISYFVGNHDPWHLTYFQEEFGISVFHHPVTRIIDDKRMHFSHGDEHATRDIRSRLARRLMRGPVGYWLYRTFVPRRLGQALPAWVSRRYHDGETRPEAVRALSDAAKRILKQDQIDIVIFGHSHVQCESRFELGSYFNSGSWYRDLSYLEIRPNTIQTRKWKPDNSTRAILNDDNGGV